MARKEYAGAAAATTLTAAIPSSGTTLSVQSTSGWPSGTDPFVIVIGRFTSTEEKILIESVAGTTYTVAASGRGYDGTSAQAHSAGETVEHCIDSITIDEANAHVNEPSRDDHTQYLDNARHDVTARHTFGSAYPTPSAGADVATSGSAGSASGPARSDHTHKVGTGAINASTMFAAGVVDAAAIGTDAVGTAEIAADAVTSSEIATDAVGTAEIAADAVTADEIAAGAVGASELATGAVTAGKIATGGVSAAGQFAAGVVDSTAILDGTIATGDLADGLVTSVKMAAADTVPHSDVGRVNPSALNSTNSTSYVSFPTASGGPLTLAFTKRLAATKVLLTLQVSRTFIATNAITGFYAVSDGTTTTELAQFAPAINTETSLSQTVDLGALAVGAKTFTLKAKASSGTGAVSVDGSSWLTFTAVETY